MLKVNLISLLLVNYVQVKEISRLPEKDFLVKNLVCEIFNGKTL